MFAEHLHELGQQAKVLLELSRFAGCPRALQCLLPGAMLEL
jgi:hypothetical protein